MKGENLEHDESVIIKSCMSMKSIHWLVKIFQENGIVVIVLASVAEACMASTF